MDIPEKESTLKKRRSLSFRIAKWWIPKFFYYTSFFIFGTARKKYHGKENFDQLVDNSQSIIVACFHQGILFLPYLLRHDRYGKRIAMVSTSPEGDYIADAMAMFGQSAARGSSTRGGKKALQVMKDMLNEGHNHEKAHHGLITVDGPRGPAHKVKMGVIKLAQDTGLPIVPFNWSAKPQITFGNWDQTILPFPFSKISVAYGKAIKVEKDTSDEKMEEIRLELEKQLKNCLDIVKGNSTIN
ncbi:lysophospholipid acyltransferase family protein [Candidatus Uabimicrobium sp. HlEnr_7]|uniref:lysophospholipid acyltransferase family protein n=1 Tax=Candidatus Uabimicrobium helgolandensis TaxID=3095367 RepID=UPI003558D941